MKKSRDSDVKRSTYRRTIQSLHIGVCEETNKRIYVSQKDAHTVAKIYRKTKSAKMEEYYCHSCHNWHIGHHRSPSRRKWRYHTQSKEFLSMIQSEEEYSLVKSIEKWRSLEDQKKELDHQIRLSKESIGQQMNALGEKEQTTALGKATVKNKKKINYIMGKESVDTNEKAFKDLLKKQGKYDLFTEERVQFSTIKLIDYVEKNEDDFNGLVELDEDFEVRFYEDKSNK